MNDTGWSRGLEVSGGGQGVVSHAGLALLRHLADRTGLTGGLSRALATAQWAAHRAAASVSGSDGGAWLEGDAAKGFACDASITPIVTGEVNPAVLEDLVRLCVQLAGYGPDDRGARAAASEDDQASPDQASPDQNGPAGDQSGPAADQASPARCGRDALQQAIIPPTPAVGHPVRSCMAALPPACDGQESAEETSEHIRTSASFLECSKN